MIDRMMSGFESVCRWWSAALSEAALQQWTVFDVQWRAGMELMQVLSRTGSNACLMRVRTQADAPVAFAQLVACAAERARQGVAPPREVYAVENRRRIDWSTFPDWARPSDPELYEGCSHEG